MSVSPFSANKHPISVDSEVYCGQTILKSNEKIRGSRETTKLNSLDELDNLNLSLFDVK